MRHFLTNLAALLLFCGSAAAQQGGIVPAPGAIYGISGTWSAPQTYTQPITGTQLSMSKNLVYSGASSSVNSMFYSTGSISGTASAGGGGLLSPFTLWIPGDSVDTGGTSLDAMAIRIAPSTGFTGTRQGILTDVEVVGTHGGTNNDIALVGGQFFVSLRANQGGKAGGYKLVGGNGYGDNPQVICASPATFLGQCVGSNVNMAVTSGASVNEDFGVNIGITSSHATHGFFDEAALVVGEGDGAVTLNNIFQVGTSSHQSPSGSNTTIMNVPARYRPQYAAPAANNGIDFRQINFQSGGFPFAAPGFFDDAVGNLSATSLTTNGNLQASAASVGSTAIIYGGLFYGNLQPVVRQPPGGGVQATMSITSWGLHTQPGKAVIQIISGGSGCTDGDILTVNGGTGTKPTLTATVVGGAVTSLVETTPGSMTALPTEPTTLTGGTCSGSPTAWLGWTALTAAVGTAGSGYPSNPQPPIDWPATATAPPIGPNWEPATFSLTMVPIVKTLALNPAGGGTSINGVASVSCAAGTVSLTTLEITNGLVTHC
jgi:hypothetical protein